MISKNSLLLFLLSINTYAFSNTIVKDKHYKTDSGYVVTVLGSCKEVFGINNLLEAGEAVRHPLILRHFVDWAQEGVDDSQTCSHDRFVFILEKIEAGDLQAIEQYDSVFYKKHQSEFYVVQTVERGVTGYFMVMCTYPSELTPVD